MSAKNTGFYEFGEFRLDPAGSTLWQGEELVPLAPKVFETLLLLVESRGRILSKGEMMGALWAEAFVEESNLSQNIYTLRRLLGKGSIENVPRRGYRFTMPVRGPAEIQPHGAREIVIASETRILTEEIFEEESPAPHQLLPEAPPRPGFLSFRSSLVLFSALTVLIFILFFTGFRYFSARVRPAPVESVNFQKLTFSGDIRFPILAPDGNSFAFVRDNALFVQDAAASNPIRVNLENVNNIGFVQFSPDGKSLYFRSPSRFHVPANVYQVSRFGGQPRLMAENVWSGFSVSKDGRLMSFIRSDVKTAEYSLILKNLETGEERNLSTYTLPARFYMGGFPAFSPDSRRIAIVVLKQGGMVRGGQLITIDIESGKVEELETPGLEQLEQVDWLPEGDALLLVGREHEKFFQLWRFDLSNKELKRVTNDLNIYRNISISTDGKKLLTRQNTVNSHLWLGSMENLTQSAQLTFGNLNRNGSAGLAFAPDGTIVYSARVSGDMDLWHFNPKDGTRRRLTENAGETNSLPTVSPDGKTIYFQSTRSGTLRIWRMDITGENQTQITFGENETERFPQISPDGQWLYYIQRGQNVSTIQRKSITGEKTEVLTTPQNVVPDSFLSISPDGKFLAFYNVRGKDEVKENQSYQVGIIPTENPAEPRFVNLPVQSWNVRWTSDGQGLYYAENNADGAKIWRQSLDQSEPRKLILDLPDETLFHVTWSSDGKQMVFSRGKQLDDAMLLSNFY